MKTSVLLFLMLLTGFLAACGEDVETLRTDSSAILRYIFYGRMTFLM